MSEVICEVVTLVKKLLWGGGAGKWRPMGWIIDYFKPTQHQHIADHWEMGMCFLLIKETEE